MHNRKPIYFRLWITASFVLSAAFVALFGSQLVDSLAQISPQPTPTWTATAPKPTSTDTPFPPTNTPPAPTNTPPAPTNTPTPLPPPPEVGPITILLPEALVAVGTFLDFTVAFTDTSPSTVTWVWGDGDTSICPPNSIACRIDWVEIVNSTSTGSQFVNGKVTGSHAYSDPGVYTVQLTVYDIHGQFDTASYEFVTVYDPTAGFVSGGGWIDSPRGAYRPDPALAGKATFGFVSEYKRGATAPTGNTRFQFKAGSLSFYSDSYDWLVVNRGGTYAQFKGAGMINGAPDPNGNGYRFMLWATDGTPDTFRMKIWWEDSSGEIALYDNWFSQPIAGGSIVVHSR